MSKILCDEIHGKIRQECSKMAKTLRDMINDDPMKFIKTNILELPNFGPYMANYVHALRVTNMSSSDLCKSDTLNPYLGNYSFFSVTVI